VPLQPKTENMQSVVQQTGLQMKKNKGGIPWKTQLKDAPVSCLQMGLFNDLIQNQVRQF